MTVTILLAVLASFSGLAALLSWWSGGRLLRLRGYHAEFDLVEHYRKRLEILERRMAEVIEPELARCAEREKQYVDLRRKYDGLETKYSSLRALIKIVQDKTESHDAKTDTLGG